MQNLNLLLFLRFTGIWKRLSDAYTATPDPVGVSIVTGTSIRCSGTQRGWCTNYARTNITKQVISSLKLIFFFALGLIVNVIFYSLLKTFCLYVDRSYRSHCLSQEIHQGYGKIAIQRARTVSWSNLKKKERSIRWKNQKSVLVSYVILEAIISTSLNNWKSK